MCTRSIDARQHLFISRRFVVETEEFQEAFGGRNFGFGQVIDRVMKLFSVNHKPRFEGTPILKRMPNDADITTLTHTVTLD